MPNRVRVVVPASTANLGPGFDCLALALALYNTFEVSIRSEGVGVEVRVEGEGAGVLPADGASLVAQAAVSLWDSSGRSAPALKIASRNGIPIDSGLGSSTTAIVGGLVAANALLGSKLDRQALLQRAHAMEGYPDNAAASIFGGLAIVSADGESVRCESLDVAPLEVVIALPAVQLSTVEARKVLPLSVPHRDAAHNIGRTALVIQALQRGDYDLLGWAMRDKLHQPYRRELIVGFDEAERAARAHGAVGVTLSGAGPSVAAFAPFGHADIAAAMVEAFDRKGMPCRTFVLPVDRQGVQVSATR